MNQINQQNESGESGIFITFEGGEGAGKTTHIQFLAENLRAQGREVVCLREPGGTVIGEELRAIVLDPKNSSLADTTELFIYEAARAQIVAEVIAPALLRGAVVLCDRFFDSTVAYQVYGRGLSAQAVAAANAFACQGIEPDRTILLCVGQSAQVGLRRATHHGQADRLEQAGHEFHSRVNEGFLKIAAENPQRVQVVQSAAKKSQTARAIFAALSDLFPWMTDPSLLDEDFFTQVDVGRYGNKAPRADVAAVVADSKVVPVGTPKAPVSQSAEAVGNAWPNVVAEESGA